MIETVRRAFGLIERGSRFPWVVVIVVALLVSAMDAIGALLILFVVGTVVRPETAFKVPVLGDLRERFPGVDENTLFRYIAVVVALFFVVRGFAMIGQVRLQFRTAHRTGVALSSRLLGGYLRMPYSWHLRASSAQLIRNTIGSVNEVVNQVLAPSVVLMSQAFTIVAMGVVLLIAAPMATLLATLVIGGTVLGLLRVVQPRLVELGKTHQENSKRALRWAQQSLHGVRDIKLLGREDYYRSRFDETRQAMERTQYVRLTLMETPRALLETVVIWLILAFVAISGVTTDTTTDSFAVMGLFAYAAIRLMPATHRIVNQLNTMRYGSAATQIVADDIAMLDAEEARREATRHEPLQFRDRIVADDVSFRYEGTPDNVLHNVSLTIAAGESVGFIGSTGGGKSTLVDVILGLLEPTSGSVTVDGVDLRSHAAAWFENLGVVSQAQFLVEDTLRRNVALGLKDEEIDDEAVDEAIDLAQLREFVRSLPEGLDTFVGERGIRFSGGQRQRVSIARALYRRPAVLVFDEGTSALDNRTEADLIRALDSLRGERTMLIVAHRLTTVRGCDRIVELEAGRIVDTGTYDELTERSPTFQTIAR